MRNLFTSRSFHTFVLVLLFVSVSLPTKAYNFEVNGLYYTILSDNTCEVSSGTNPYTGDIVIPSTVSYADMTFNVVSIGEKAFKEATTTSISIPSSIEIIKSEAFNMCKMLTTITLPASLRTVEKNIFVGCTALITINVDENNTNFSSEGAFLLNKDKTELISAPYGKASITIPNTVKRIRNDASSYNDILSSISFPEGLESIGDYAFRSCRKLSTLNLPSTLKHVGDNAFGYCSELTSVNLPTTMNHIGDYAFSNCEKLSTINLPATLRELGKNAFCKTAIKGVTIPQGITIIPQGIFSECSELENIKFHDAITRIEASAFYGCKGSTSIDLPDSLKYIGRNAFYSWDNLFSLTLPSKVDTIDSKAFSSCQALYKVTIPESVRYLGSNAFKDCKGLGIVNFNAISAKSPSGDYTSPFYNCPNISIINWGSKVESIPAGLVRGCTKITSLTIPETVNYIGMNAFNDCTGLKVLNFNANDCICEDGYPFDRCGVEELNIGENVTTIPNGLFVGLHSLSEITVPNSVKSIGYQAFLWCSNLKKITIGESVETIGEWIYSDGLETLNFNAINCQEAKEFGSYVKEINFGDKVKNIPNNFAQGSKHLIKVDISHSVENIGNAAFKECATLEKITLPNSLLSIGESAFKGCAALESITIPNSVKVINSYTFEGCKHLREAVLGTGVESIGYQAFYECKLLESIKFPETLKYIGDYVFSSDSLQEITLPASLKNISKSAFYDCDSLKSVFMEGAIPATCGSTVFPSDTKIYVPMSALTDYKTSSSWKNQDLLGLGFALQTDDKYTTHYSDVAYAMPDGVSGGIITAANQEELDIDYRYQSGDIVPACTPLLIKKNVSSYSEDEKTVYDYIPVKTEEIAATDNLLQGVLKDTNITEDATYHYYSLTLDSSEENFGFYPTALNGIFSTKAQEAYLILPKETGRNDGYILEHKEVTAIDAPHTCGNVREIERYAPDGRRIASSQSGINIVRYSNGEIRKVFVK